LIVCLKKVESLLWFGSGSSSPGGLLRRYADAAAEIAVFAYLFLFKWVWPLWMARAVRIRGGKFGTSYAIAIIFGIIAFVFYLARWSGRSILENPTLDREAGAV